MANCLGPPFRDANSHSSLRDSTSSNFGRCAGLVGFLTGFGVPGILHYYSPRYRHSYNLLPLYDNNMVTVSLLQSEMIEGKDCFK